MALQIPEACVTESFGKSRQQRGQSVFVLGASVLMELARGKKIQLKKQNKTFSVIVVCKHMWWWLGGIN